MSRYRAAAAFLKEETHMTRSGSKTVIAGLCLAAATAIGSGAAIAQSGEPVRIGLPTALSGPYAGLGAEAKRAVEFAVAEANAKGGVQGRKVELKVLDTEAKPDVARKQAERLALDGYKILVGTIASGEGLAMAPMLDRWDALYVSTINKSNKLTGDSCVPRMFRVNHSDAQDAAVVKPWLATRKEGERGGRALGRAGRSRRHQFRDPGQAVRAARFRFHGRRQLRDGRHRQDTGRDLQGHLGHHQLQLHTGHARQQEVRRGLAQELLG